MKFFWVCYLVVKIRLLLSHRDVETGTLSSNVGWNECKFFGYLEFSQAGTLRRARVILESGLKLLEAG